MKTQVLCPECMKEHLERPDPNKPEAKCPHCGTKFVFTGVRQVRYA